MRCTVFILHRTRSRSYTVKRKFIKVCGKQMKKKKCVVFTSNCFFPPGGVILYAGSSGSGSPSPGSPSSGYQTQSPSTHSQPSSPEEVTFTEIGALKQHNSTGTPSSPKLVFQFPEVYSSSTTSSNQNTYAHPITGKRPCGFTGTFTSKH